jgi:hypothetical protein
MGSIAGDVRQYQYCFVLATLNPSHTAASTFYIVPGNIVRATVQKQFKKYEATLKAKGQETGGKRGVYHFADPKGLYLGKWEHPGLPVKKARTS